LPGLLELSAGVGFRRPDRLAALTSLTSLSVRLVPLPELDGVAALPSLRALTLSQVAPLSARQADALARCGALTRLALDPLPWELLPALGALPRLRALSVHLQPQPRGGLPPVAADALLELCPLSRLQSFALAGQVDLAEHHVAALAAAWPALRSLDLCCGLIEGTSGFAALSALRRLRLSPYQWDVWSNEAPLLLHPAELPASLTCLEARDVWVAAPGPDAARLGSAPSSDFSWSVGVCPAVARRGAAAPGATAAASSSSAGPSSAYAPGVGVAAMVTGCGGGACGLGVDCACFALSITSDEESDDSSSVGGVGNLDEAAAIEAIAGPSWRKPNSPFAPARPEGPPPLSPSERAAALTLSTPQLRRLVLRCIGTAHCEEPLPLPRLARLTGLQELDLHHSQVTAADLETITTAPAAASLRALRLVLVDGARGSVGSALTKLTRLTALETLQVGVWARGERGARARRGWEEQGRMTTQQSAQSGCTQTRQRPALPLLRCPRRPCPPSRSAPDRPAPGPRARARAQPPRALRNRLHDRAAQPHAHHQPRRALDLRGGPARPHAPAPARAAARGAGLRRGRRAAAAARVRGARAAELPV
jgi:hypothetical protein